MRRMTTMVATLTVGLAAATIVPAANASAAPSAPTDEGNLVCDLTSPLGLPLLCPDASAPPATTPPDTTPPAATAPATTPPIDLDIATDGATTVDLGLDVGGLIDAVVPGGLPIGGDLDAGLDVTVSLDTSSSRTAVSADVAASVSSRSLETVSAPANDLAGDDLGRVLAGAHLSTTTAIEGLDGASGGIGITNVTDADVAGEIAGLDADVVTGNCIGVGVLGAAPDPCPLSQVGTSTPPGVAPEPGVVPGGAISIIEDLVTGVVTPAGGADVSSLACVAVGVFQSAPTPCPQSVTPTSPDPAGPDPEVGGDPGSGGPIAGGDEPSAAGDESASEAPGSVSGSGGAAPGSVGSGSGVGGVLPTAGATLAVVIALGAIFTMSGGSLRSLVRRTRI